MALTAQQEQRLIKEVKSLIQDVDKILKHLRQQKASDDEEHKDVFDLEGRDRNVDP